MAQSSIVLATGVSTVASTIERERLVGRVVFFSRKQEASHGGRLAIM